MRNILFLFLLFSAPAFGQITTDGPTHFTDGTKKSFDTPDIYVSFSYNIKDETFSVGAAVVKTGGTLESDVEEVFYYSISKADVDLVTGTGTGDTKKLHNAIEQALIVILESIAENTGITFTPSP
jgi:hypothetical protein